MFFLVCKIVFRTINPQFKPPDSHFQLNCFQFQLDCFRFQLNRIHFQSNHFYVQSNCFHFELDCFHFELDSFHLELIFVSLALGPTPGHNTTVFIMNKIAFIFNQMAVMFNKLLSNSIRLLSFSIKSSREFADRLITKPVLQQRRSVPKSIIYRETLGWASNEIARIRILILLSTIQNSRDEGILTLTLSCFRFQLDCFRFQ